MRFLPPLEEMVHKVETECKSKNGKWLVRDPVMRVPGAVIADPREIDALVAEKTLAYENSLRNEHCELPAADGGKSCKSSSECEKQTCFSKENFASETSKPGEETTGICATYLFWMGCAATVENGIRGTAVCRD